MTIVSSGIDPALFQSRRCARMSSALTTSGTSCVQPGYSRTSTLSSDGIWERVLYRFRSSSRKYAGGSARGSCHGANNSLLTPVIESDGGGAYSPNTVTRLPFACAFSQRKPPDEYASGSFPSEGYERP